MMPLGMQTVENGRKIPKSFPFSYLFDRSKTEKSKSEYVIEIIGHSKTIKSEQKICW
jgi:hypothetical protein